MKHLTRFFNGCLIVAASISDSERTWVDVR